MGVTLNTGQLSDIITYSNGNIGIGTATPAERLEVFAPAVAGTSQQARLRITQAGSISARANLVSGVISGENPYFAIETRQSASPFAIVERLRIDGNGNVGIGTSSPQSRLEISGATPFITITDTATVAENGIQMGAPLIRGGLTINYSTGEFKLFCGITNNTYYQTFHVNGAERMRITSGGQLQVRQDALFGLDFNSTQYISISENQIRRVGNAILFINNSNTGDVSININGGGTFVNGTNGYGRAVTNSSDVRIKKNISSIDNALNKVLQMNGVYYEFNNENELGINVPSGNTRIGLIAQDIENILPEAVLTPLEENQPKSIDYSGMIGLLINAINELNAKVTALENK